MLLSWRLALAAYAAPSTGISINVCWRCSQSSKETESACTSNPARLQLKQCSRKGVRDLRQNECGTKLKIPCNAPLTPINLCPSAPIRVGGLDLGSLPAARLCPHSAPPCCPHCRLSCAPLWAQSTKPCFFPSPFFFLRGQTSCRLSSTRRRQQCQGGQRTKWLEFPGNEECRGLLWKCYHTRLTVLTGFF